MVNNFLKKYLNIFTILILFLIYVKSKNYFLEILALSILIIEIVILILFYLIKNKLYTIIQTPNSKDIFALNSALNLSIIDQLAISTIYSMVLFIDLLEGIRSGKRT